MFQNKNIDRLFKEKFRDFEMQPEPEVWSAIEANLNKDKERKPVLFWFRLAGVAALFLLLFTIGNNLFNQQKNDKNNVVVNPIKQDAKTINNKDINTLKVEDNLISNTQNNTLVNSKKLTVITKVQNKNTQLNARLSNKYTTTSFFKKSINSEKILSNNETKIQNKIITLNKNTKNNTQVKPNSETVKLNEKEIKPKNEKTNIKDALAKNEEPIIDEKLKTKKFSVGTIYSPIYYASLENGSPIDQSISNNNVSNNYSSSYGVKFEYKINKKWTIQTGVHNVELAYTTNDVNVSLVEPITSFNNEFSNLQVTNDGKRINVTPQQNSPFSLQPLTILSSNGNIQQSIGYLEVPLEVKYNLINKNFDVQLLGGFSTLFLNNNEVLLNNSVSTFILGEASNLNKTNFSANLGVDLNYNISNSWFINLSPSFKYQLDTFSENSGGFKPYTININTGLNFRF